MKRILFVLCLMVVVFAAVDSFAAPDGEETITATGGFRFATINSTGPALLEVLANGTATIKIISSVDGAGTDPNTARRVWPEGVFGKTVLDLRDQIPRPFDVYGDSADSVLVTLGTATEVILTWTNAN